MKNLKIGLGVLILLLFLNSQVIYGYDPSQIKEAFESETALSLAKAAGLILFVGGALNFGGRVVDKVKEYITGKGSGGGDSEERRRAREEENEKRKRAREAKKSRKSINSYGGGSHNPDFSIEPIAYLVGGAFAAADWVGEKACAAGRWVKDRVKTGVNAVRATRTPTPKNLARVANSDNEDKKQEGGK